MLYYSLVSLLRRIAVKVTSVLPTNPQGGENEGSGNGSYHGSGCSGAPHGAGARFGGAPERALGMLRPRLCHGSERFAGQRLGRGSVDLDPRSAPATADGSRGFVLVQPLRPGGERMGRLSDVPRPHDGRG